MHFHPDRGFIHPRSAEITPREVYEQRRAMLRLIAGGAAGATLAAWAGREAHAQTARPNKLAALPGARSAVPGALTMDKPTGYADITSYNNYYEFGTDKADPARNAGTPEDAAVDGRGRGRGRASRQVYDIDELLKLAPMEERIYRLRCVEAWSMVIPWVGFSLAELIKRVEPTGNAKYVEFVTLADPKQMPGVRLARARLAVRRRPAHRRGDAPAGAARRRPLRRGAAEPERRAAARWCVPWKYGFKSGKSIVKIRFVEKQPQTSWEMASAAASTASTPTSTRTSTIRAGARPPSGASARTACSPRSGRR